MKKIELKHLAPYLPYALKFYRPYLIYTGGELPQPDHEEYGLDEVTLENASIVIESGMPIALKPMDDLLKPPYILKFGYRQLSRNKKDGKNIESFTLDQYEYLFSNHFDVFGLIEQGLAVDINTI